MKKTLFLSAILGAVFCGSAYGAMTTTITTTATAGDSITRGEQVSMGYTPVLLTIDLAQLSTVTEDTKLITVWGSFNTSETGTRWGVRAVNGGNVTGTWNANAWTNAGTTQYSDILAAGSEGSVTLLAKVSNDGTSLTAVSGVNVASTDLYSAPGLKSAATQAGAVAAYQVDDTIVTAAHKAILNEAATVSFAGGSTATYDSVAHNSISDTDVEATIIGGGTANARVESKGANTDKLSSHGGDIIIGTKGQLYFTGGTLNNDVYIGGSDIYTEQSAGYNYGGDLRMQGDSGVELAGNLILTDNATIVGDGNGVISGEIQGAGKNLTINVGASGVNKTMTFSGGGELNDLTIGTETQRIGLKFTGEDFSVNSITTSGAITVDGVKLSVAQDETTINTLTLNAGSTIDIANDSGSLTTSALTVNGDTTINADLVTAANSTLTFTEGVVTLSGSIDFGTGTTIALGEAYHPDLEANGKTLIFTDVDAEGGLINGLENVVVTGAFQSGHLIAVQNAQTGKYDIYATPEPATATLSLLALAGLMARRRRH